MKWLSALTCIGMYIVLIAGALVTKTDSGRGCGDDWPLCNGKFIPAYTLESMIEYSHRAVTGLVGIIVLLTFIKVIQVYGRRSEPFFYAAGIAFFTVLQAILGAMAVKWEQSSAVMALHFGFSLLAFTFTALLVLIVWRTKKSSLEVQTPVKAGFRRWVWFVTAYTYAVVYTGAYVRHTESSGGCEGWPLCNNQVIPELTGAAGTAFGHRIAALITLLLIIVIVVKCRRDYPQHQELIKVSAAALLLVLFQVFSGAFVVLTLTSANAHVFAGLIHSTIISALFAILSYLSIRVWQMRE